MPVTHQGARIDEINVILQVEGLGNRKVATIRLGRSDASVYVAGAVSAAVDGQRRAGCASCDC